jgi:dTDP-4-dehydrorhamnose reductase
MTRSVVVLGSSGLLGQALMAELGRRKVRAVGLSRAAGVDLAAAKELGPILEPYAPVLVINASAITNLEHCEHHPAEAWMLHARLPALLAAWSAGSGVPWVQVSTDHYYSSTRNELHDEQAPVLLLNEYARSKYAGEAAALASPHALVARTNIVGRRGWPGQPSFAEWVVASLLGNRPFAGYTDAWASSLEAGQCAAALLDLVRVGARGLVNVAARESTSKAQFISDLAAALDLPSTHMKPQPRPASTLPRANALGLDVGHAERLLGRPLPTAQQVAARLAAVFKEKNHHVPA